MWYQSPGVIFYQLFLRSFYDSNNDGIGDIGGLRQKINYLKGLGVNALWLMPLHSSPSYHKYDVLDYFSIDPDYGTLEEFKILVSELHKAGIKIIIDFVANHTSNKHPWFREAVKGRSNPYYDFYVWENEEIIGDRERWYKDENQNEDSVKYFAHFCKEMPDLNYDNPQVREMITEVGKFWLEEMDIDGFRLDAAQHIYPETELHKSIEWWEEFFIEMRKVKNDVFLVGEVWSMPVTVAPFLKSIPSVLNFELGYKILDTVRKGKDYLNLIGLYNSIRSLYTHYSQEITDSIFLANHDQDRVMSTFRGSEQKAKLAAAILFTLPGVPFIYYGEELGMKGTKPDEHIREPFPWGNDKGQTNWIKKKHRNVSLQLMKDQGSIWHHYRKLIHLRKKEPLFSNGIIKKFEKNDSGILSYKIISSAVELWVFHNLSGKEHIIALPPYEKKSLYLLFKTEKSCRKQGKSLFLTSRSTLIFKLLKY